MEWTELRAKESMGFVSKRIAPLILSKHIILYGSSFCINYGKFKRVLFPWEVCIINP